MRKPQAITLRQVAERAGCSIPAAAGALHGGGGTARVSEELRRRVEQAAAELGYQPNYHARALRQRRSRVLGLAVRAGKDPPSNFWGQIILGLTQGAREAQHSLLILGEDVAAAVETVRRRQADALLVPSMLFPDKGEWLEAQDVPLVWLFPPPGSQHTGLSMDHRAGMCEAADHLAVQGHRNVLWMGQSRNGEVQDPERLAHFTRAASISRIAVQERTVDITPYRSQNDLIRKFYAALVEYLDRNPPPTAIVAYNDTAAQGIYAALADRGLRVPVDVSVIGYDDLNAELAWPPMTVVSLRLPQLGREWGSLAIEVADGTAPELQGGCRMLPTQLVIRESTGPANKIAGSSST